MILLLRMRIGDNFYFAHSICTKLTVIFLFISQVYILGYLHGWNGDKVYREGFHIEQVYVPAKSVELAGFFSHHKRLRYYRYGGGESGRFENLQGPESSQNSIDHAW